MQIFTFIGLGNMGFQMVQHLIRRKNTHVNIFDINKKIYKKFTQKNITKLNSIEDLPKETNVFFTMRVIRSGLLDFLVGSSDRGRHQCRRAYFR